MRCFPQSTDSSHWRVIFPGWGSSSANWSSFVLRWWWLDALEFLSHVSLHQSGVPRRTNPEGSSLDYSCFEVHPDYAPRWALPWSPSQTSIAAQWTLAPPEQTGALGALSWLHQWIMKVSGWLWYGIHWFSCWSWLDFLIVLVARGTSDPDYHPHHQSDRAIFLSIWAPGSPWAAPRTWQSLQSSAWVKPFSSMV